MILKELKLKNFRGIAKTTIKFQPKMNIIIGINGSGKTSILDAIALLMARTLPLFNEKPSFDKKDITAKQTSAKMELKFKSNLYNKKGMSNVLCEGFINEETKYIIDFENSKNEITKTMIEGSILDSAPLIAYYPTSRAVLDVSIKADNESTFNQIDAYDNCLTGHSNFNALFNWYRNTDDIYNADSVDEELKHEATELLNEATELLNEATELIHENKEESDELMPEYKKRIDKVKELIRKVRRIKNHLLKFVEKAILECTAFTSLGLDRTSNKFLLKKDDVVLDINMLSHGEKIYIALVGDIARRLTMLNPKLKNPLEGNGVVLIDEIELHLHPQWQASILSKLQNIFPNCQFIVTTHSPQVLHAIKSDQIFILEDFEILKPSEEVYGKTSNQILEYFMGTQKRDPDVQKQIDYIYELISEEEYEKAKKYFDELESKIIEDPEITRLNHILNRFSKVSTIK